MKRKGNKDNRAERAAAMQDTKQAQRASGLVDKAITHGLGVEGMQWAAALLEQQVERVQGAMERACAASEELPGGEYDRAGKILGALKTGAHATTQLLATYTRLQKLHLDYELDRMDGNIEITMPDMRAQYAQIKAEYEKHGAGQDEPKRQAKRRLH